MLGSVLKLVSVSLVFLSLQSNATTYIKDRWAIEEALLSRNIFNERLVHLAQDEGIVLEVYRDSRKLKTIGIGHLLTKEEKRSGVVYGVNIKDGLTLDEALHIFDMDVEKHDRLAEKLMLEKGIDIKKLSWDQEMAIKDMVFQLGYAGASKFTHTFKLIKEGKYEAAAKAVTKSLWYKQTKKRVQRFQLRIVMRK